MEKLIKMKNMSKLKHQVKSNKYYLFWGAATIAVMAGQIYVGNGYRGMSESVKDLTEMIEIQIELEEMRGRNGYIYYISQDPTSLSWWQVSCLHKDGSTLT